jgi:hypothetical protein
MRPVNAAEQRPDKKPLYVLLKRDKSWTFDIVGLYDILTL